jgi:hypothetical protein
METATCNPIRPVDTAHPTSNENKIANCPCEVELTRTPSFRHTHAPPLAPLPPPGAQSTTHPRIDATEQYNPVQPPPTKKNGVFNLDQRLQATKTLHNQHQHSPLMWPNSATRCIEAFSMQFGDRQTIAHAS